MLTFCTCDGSPADRLVFACTATATVNEQTVTLTASGTVSGDD